MWAELIDMHMALDVAPNTLYAQLKVRPLIGYTLVKSA
jgi:hypothetical protein